MSDLAGAYNSLIVAPTLCSAAKTPFAWADGANES
jgi:hypothetical protein